MAGVITLKGCDAQGDPLERARGVRYRFRPEYPQNGKQHILFTGCHVAGEPDIFYANLADLFAPVRQMLINKPDDPSKFPPPPWHTPPYGGLYSRLSLFRQTVRPTQPMEQPTTTLPTAGFRRGSKNWSSAVNRIDGMADVLAPQCFTPFSVHERLITVTYEYLDLCHRVDDEPGWSLRVRELVDGSLAYDPLLPAGVYACWARTIQIEGFDEPFTALDLFLGTTSDHLSPLEPLSITTEFIHSPGDFRATFYGAPEFKIAGRWERGHLKYSRHYLEPLERVYVSDRGAADGEPERVRISDVSEDPQEWERLYPDDVW